MSSTDNFVSFYHVDSIDDHSDEVMPTLVKEEHEFTKMLQRVDKVETDVGEGDIDIEEEDENSDTDLSVKRGFIEKIEGRDDLDLLLSHQFNSCINAEESNAPGGGAEVLPQFEQGSYCVQYRLVQVNGKNVRFDSRIDEIKNFNTIHFDTEPGDYKVDDANQLGMLDFSNTLHETGHSNHHTQTVYSDSHDGGGSKNSGDNDGNNSGNNESEVNSLRATDFKVSDNCLNQMNGLVRYRVFYKKKYYIFEFNNGCLTQLKRGVDDGS
ncbi:hypothetical protein [Grimontia hollisae]|uniref:hypothetical protein n=1 Tax=Grimontia hollisae TaxID=673 RepID=UPI00165E10FD|nr:hypothetical protein [Grimontia hollisae]